MSNSVGKLVATLGLDAAEYQRGLTKAEADAKKFAQNTRAAIEEVGKVLAQLEIGRQVFTATKDIIAEAAALSDLSQATGASVESLSRLNNQSKIAGADFATLEKAVLKLSAGMSGVESKGTKTNEVLALLGVTAKDPVEALQQVAIKLNTYADGINKVGIAQRLFGQEGRAFLKTLQDIAELQDVTATVTTKQAQEAEALEKAYRRLGAQASAFKGIILNDLVPALNEVLARLNDGAKAAGSFGQGLEAALGVALRPGAAADQLKTIEASIARIKQEAKDNKLQLFPGLREETLNSLEAQKKIALAARDRQILGRFGAESTFDARDFKAQQKPQAPKPPGDDKSARAIKAQRDEAEALLDTLLKTQQATLDLTTEETARIAILDIELKTMREVNAEVKAQILDSARQIDQAKEAKKAAAEARRAAEEDAKARARMAEDKFRAIEAAKRETEGINQGNEQIREQLILLRDGEQALFAYTQAKLADAAADKERHAGMLLAIGDEQNLAPELLATAKALKERAALLSDTKATQDFINQQKQLQDDLGRLFDSAANAFEEFRSGSKSAKDAFKDFAKSIEKDLAKMAVEFLKNQLFGNAGGSGSGLFGLFAKLFSGTGSSGGGFSGSFDGGFSGGGFGEHFGTGGVSRGGFATVGENGPEVVELPAGARVHSNAASRSMGGNVYNIHQTIMPGADTRAHRQKALDAFNGVMGTARRR